MFLKEIKAIVELDTSEVIAREDFLLYLNSALRDFSETYKMEKESSYTINENDIEHDLPTDLFQVVTVVIDNISHNIKNNVVKEVAVYDYDLYRSNGISGTIGHMYSRYKNKLRVNTGIYSDGQTGSESTISYRYYGKIPTYNYEADDTVLPLASTELSLVIQEEQYQEALSFYIAYRYFLNHEQPEKATAMLSVWEMKKSKIKTEVHSHRHASNISRKIRMTRS